MISNLLSLPNELLLEIFRYLDHASQHAFALSSQRLRMDFIPLCPEVSFALRLEIRTRLARDGVPFQEYSFCSGCETIHRRKFFTPEQLELPSKSRCCRASQRQLWIAPGQFLSFNDVLREAPGVQAWSKELLTLNKPIITRLFSSRAAEIHMDSPKNIRQCSLGQVAVCASYGILNISNERTPSKEEVTRILSGFDIPTCPHMKLGDRAVADSFNESWDCIVDPEKNAIRWHSQIQSPRPDTCCRFPGCKTAFRWVYRPSAERVGWKTLVLQMRRHLGRMLSPESPRWMAQLLSVPDKTRLTAYWNGCQQWREVNMIIEEKRHERELNRGNVSKGMGFKFEQLKRENDYLRHPNAHINLGGKHMLPDLDSLSRFREKGIPQGEMPPTTDLLWDAQTQHDARNSIGIAADLAQGCRSTAIKIEDKPDEPNIIADTMPDLATYTTPIPSPLSKRQPPLYSPLHDLNVVLAEISRQARLNTSFEKNRPWAPLRRKLFPFSLAEIAMRKMGVSATLRASLAPLAPWPNTDLEDSAAGVTEIMRRQLEEYERTEDGVQEII
ncbi:hypothetical protein BJY04DRAFT_187649 [Aspergillus karnatakaensis]|uniref:uncharacterized protein n=1 Tax=Aspergillus karnatakaensis TaxID=1810916 RepID=UPI003CCD1767